MRRETVVMVGKDNRGEERGLGGAKSRKGKEQGTR